MASATPVTDHDEIREWVESRGGRPACVKGTAALLRVDFGEPDEKLQPIEWDQWFETFDSRNLAALIQQGGRSRFLKLVSRESAARTAAPRSARPGAGREDRAARRSRPADAGGRTRRPVAEALAGRAVVRRPVAAESERLPRSAWAGSPRHGAAPVRDRRAQRRMLLAAAEVRAARPQVRRRAAAGRQPAAPKRQAAGRARARLAREAVRGRRARVVARQVGAPRVAPRERRGPLRRERVQAGRARAGRAAAAAAVAERRIGVRRH